MPLKDFFSKRKSQRDSAKPKLQTEESRAESKLDRQSGSSQSAPSVRAEKPIDLDVHPKVVGAPVPQVDINRRVRHAAESMLENESLTTDLDDQTAKALLDWGIAGAERAARDTQGLDDEQAEEHMYPRMRANRKLMRSVNKLLARRAELSAEEQTSLLDEIASHAAILYGEQEQISPDPSIQSLLVQAVAPAVESAEAVRRLRQVFESASKPPQSSDNRQLESLDPPGGSESGELKIT